MLKCGPKFLNYDNKSTPIGQNWKRGTQEATLPTYRDQIGFKPIKFAAQILYTDLRMWQQHKQNRTCSARDNMTHLEERFRGGVQTSASTREPL